MIREDGEGEGDGGGGAQGALWETELRGSRPCTDNFIQLQLLAQRPSLSTPHQGLGCQCEFEGDISIAGICALKRGKKLGCVCSLKPRNFFITFRGEYPLLKGVATLNNSDKGYKSHRNQRPKPKFQWVSWELQSHQKPGLLSVYSLWGSFFIRCFLG